MWCNECWKKRKNAFEKELKKLKLFDWDWNAILTQETFNKLQWLQNKTWVATMFKDKEASEWYSEWEQITIEWKTYNKTQRWWIVFYV